MLRSRYRANSVDLDSLEPRRHLTALVVNGSNQSDEIRMSVTDSTIIITVDDFPTGYPRVIYNSVSIQGNNGSDSIYIDSNVDVPVTVNTGSGDDVVHLADSSQNLDDVGSGVTVQSSSGNDGIFLQDDSSSFSDTYTVNNSRISRGFFGGVSYSGVGYVKLFTGGGADTFDVVNTNGANLIVDGQAGADVLNLNANGAGLAEVTFESDQDFAAVTSAPGGNLTLAGNAGLLLTTNGSNFEGNVTLGTGYLVERNSQVVGGLGYWRTRLVKAKTSATPFLASSYATSSAASDAIGYAYAQDLPFTDFHGVTLNSGDLLLRYTLKGDTDLNGTVNFDDLVKVAQNYGSTAGVQWRQGDFDLSGGVDFDDLVPLAQNYNATASSVLLTAKAKTAVVARRRGADLLA